MALHRDFKNLLISLLESGLTKLIWAEQQSRWGCWLFHLRAGNKLGTKKLSRCYCVWRMGQKESEGQWPNTFHLFVCSVGGLGKVHGHPQAAAVTAVKKGASHIF